MSQNVVLKRSYIDFQKSVGILVHKLGNNNVLKVAGACIVTKALHFQVY